MSVRRLSTLTLKQKQALEESCAEHIYCWIKNWFGDDKPEFTFNYSTSIFGCIEFDGEKRFSNASSSVLGFSVSQHHQESESVWLATQALHLPAIEVIDQDVLCSELSARCLLDFSAQILQSSSVELVELVEESVSGIINKPFVVSISFNLNGRELSIALCRDAAQGLFEDKCPTQSSEQPVIRLDQSLENAQIQLDVSLAATKVTLSDLMNLKPGDVIKLNQKLNEPVKLTDKNNSLEIKGFIGKYNNKLALVVSK